MFVLPNVPYLTCGKRVCHRVWNVTHADLALVRFGVGSAPDGGPAMTAALPVRSAPMKALWLILGAYGVHGDPDGRVWPREVI